MITGKETQLLPQEIGLLTMALYGWLWCHSRPTRAINTVHLHHYHALDEQAEQQATLTGNCRQLLLSLGASG